MAAPARPAPAAPVPIPMGVGEPDFGYPWPWAVSRWLDGEVATVEGLAGFLAALQRVAPGEDREGLTVRSLADRDGATRAAIAAVDGTFDAVAMTELWDAALGAPGWDRPPVWFHGDLHTGNLLTTDGRLDAVIDFGERDNPRVAAQTTRQLTEALIGWRTAGRLPLLGVGATPGSGGRPGADRAQKVTSEQA